jgi:hypothetical protein
MPGRTVLFDGARWLCAGCGTTLVISKTDPRNWVEAHTQGAHECLALAVREVLGR